MGLEHPRVPDRVDGRARLLGEAQLEVVVDAARVAVEERGRPACRPPSSRAPACRCRPAPAGARPRLPGVIPKATCRRPRSTSGGVAGPPQERPSTRSAERREALPRHQLPHLLGEQHLAGGEPHHRGVAGAEEPLHLDLAQLVQRPGQLAGRHRVVAGRHDPERAQAVPVQVRDRRVAVAGHDRRRPVAGPEHDRPSTRGRRPGPGPRRPRRGPPAAARSGPGAARARRR